MKYILFVFTLGFIAFSAQSQHCDISQNGIVLYNSSNDFPVTSVKKGQSAYFRFSIKNLGTNLDCTIPSNSITAVFDFPTLAGGLKPYRYDGPPSFVSGYFTWTYNTSEDVLMGTNTTIIPAGEGDQNISVKVKANEYGAGSSNLNITQEKGVSDNASNNFSTAKLIVPKFVNLISFIANPDKCNVFLNWKTISESGLSHFEVEYSSDGISFSNAGRVEGRDLTAGAEYRFSYLQPNREGYYRLKEIARDGTSEYSETVHVSAECSMKPTVTVFPNPIDYNRKLIVTITGFSGKIAGELFSASGQRVSVHNLSNGTNELSVNNLSAGSYMLYVNAEGSEVQSFKVIVTR